MKPSQERYYKTEHEVWAFLWRLMPHACKDMLKHQKTIKQSQERQFNVPIKNIV